MNIYVTTRFLCIAFLFSQVYTYISQLITYRIDHYIYFFEYIVVLMSIKIQFFFG